MVHFTHVQTCNASRVQSATEWTTWVHTLHMSKPIMYSVFKCYGMHGLQARLKPPSSFLEAEGFKPPSSPFEASLKMKPASSPSKPPSTLKASSPLQAPLKPPSSPLKPPSSPLEARFKVKPTSSPLKAFRR